MRHALGEAAGVIVGDAPVRVRDPWDAQRDLEAMGFVFPVGSDGVEVEVEVRRKERRPLGAFARSDHERAVVAAVERGQTARPKPPTPAWLAAPPAAQWGRPLAEHAFAAMHMGVPYRPLQPRDLAEAQGFKPRLYEPPARRGERW